MFVVFDLDGTLADITHRLHFIQQQPKDWRGFFAACVDDQPIWPMIEICRTMIETELHTVEVWSGRSDEVRLQTNDWLHRHKIWPDMLRMRTAGDHRPDDEVKAEWLDQVSVCGPPDIAFDDRQRIVNMWRSRGVRCCQVAPGDF